MKKAYRRVIIACACAAVIAVAVPVSVTAVKSATQSSRQVSAAEEFDNFTPKTEFASRSEVVAELNRLGTAYKNAIAGHGPDAYRQQAMEKFEAMSTELQVSLSKFPAPPADPKKEIESWMKYFNDNTASYNPDLFPEQHKDELYMENEAKGIYAKYKSGALTAEQTLEKLLELRDTDRKNGIKH
jgi:hypothetical protein